MKDKDAYEKLPESERLVVEAHGKSMGLSPQEVHQQYLDAQTRLHPVKLWHNNLFKRQRKGA